MTAMAQIVSGTTTHARRGALRNAFRYGVDYVLIDPSAPAGTPLFSRNRFNLFSVSDQNHGGRPKRGEGAQWARNVFDQVGVPAGYDLRLLTQPAMLGYVFNPVSFWLAFDGTDLICVIAEVNNTFGDRYSYVCRNEGFAKITADQSLFADKVMHVSPFQQTQGSYKFNFDIDENTVRIRIFFENGDAGVIATFHGKRSELNSRTIVASLWRRPFGALRTITLIYWQALCLRIKGAKYLTRPEPPTGEVSK